MYLTIYGRSEELVSWCVECNLAEPESLASLGGSAPGLADRILSILDTYLFSNSMGMVGNLYKCKLDTAVSLLVLMLLHLVSLLSDTPWP